ncbi:RipA family octameric membrane protein [Bacillus halotolerans]
MEESNKFLGSLIVISGCYFAVLTAKNGEMPYKDESLLLISCLGTIVSWSWYLVNRGNKFW